MRWPFRKRTENPNLAYMGKYQGDYPVPKVGRDENGRFVSLDSSGVPIRRTPTASRSKGTGQRSSSKTSTMPTSTASGSKSTGQRSSSKRSTTPSKKSK